MGLFTAASVGGSLTAGFLGSIAGSVVAMSISSLYAALAMCDQVGLLPDTSNWRARLPYELKVWRGAWGSAATRNDWACPLFPPADQGNNIDGGARVNAPTATRAHTCMHMLSMEAAGCSCVCRRTLIYIHLSTLLHMRHMQTCITTQIMCS